jgi:hypothetical protein
MRIVEPIGTAVIDATPAAVVGNDGDAILYVSAWR